MFILFVGVYVHNEKYNYLFFVEYNLTIIILSEAIINIIIIIKHSLYRTMI